jgi:SAM-dependent methyltransferase
MKVPAEIEDWYARAAAGFERSYLNASDPWSQSGHFGSAEDWERLRRPLADCVDRDGHFLDIGCANGYLLECLIGWTAERGIALEPWGLDISRPLVELARLRLPLYRDRLFVGSSLAFEPPRRFDYVRTGLHYAPPSWERKHLQRLRERFLGPGGRLLVVEYRSAESPAELDVDRRLVDRGFPVSAVRTAEDGQGRESVRVAVVPAA